MEQNGKSKHLHDLGNDKINIFSFRTYSMCPTNNLWNLGIHFVELKGKPSYKQLDLCIKQLQTQYTVFA